MAVARVNRPRELAGLNTRRIGAGLGSSPVLPTSFTGLQIWLDASTGCFQDAGKATACTNGTTVYTWADLSGNGRDVIQATAANRPLWNDSGTGYHPNNRAIVVFDGTNDFLSHTGFAFSYPCTLMVVGRRNNATAGTIGALAGNFAAGAPGNTTVTIRSGDGSTLTNGVGFARDAVPANISDGMTGFSDATWWVWEFVAAASTLELKRSGNTTGTTAGTPSGMTSQPFNVGARSNAGADPFPGAIAELFVHTGTDAARDNILRAYLGAKYGITVV